MNEIIEKRVAIVVLNYMNYLEADECIQSILKQDYSNYHILLVDNGSTNASCHYLQEKYGNNKKISILKTGKNYGFAKGNNIGISYARKKLGAEYVMLLNSDIIINDNTYLRKMVGADSLGVGVIGSRILEPNNKTIKMMYRYVTFPASIYQYLTLLAEYLDHPLYHLLWKNKLKKYKGTHILKGCDLLLTPAYFQCYKDLDPRTFLYCEEELLYLRCRKAGLKEKLITNTYLYHKDGQSTKILYGNERKVFLKYMLASYKYVVLESICMLLCGVFLNTEKNTAFD